MTRTIAALFAATLALTLAVDVGGAVRAQESGAALPPQQRNFVTCPVVRDTATLPCWLAEYKGELYYLGAQGSSGSAFYPPQLLHEVLVEGTVAAGPRICGGIPLRPLHVSVMPEINRSCNTVLPAEAGYAPAPSPLAPAPRFADTAREFVVPYDFDSDYLTLHTTRIVVEAARIAKLAAPSKISVKGQRGATRLSDGRILKERPGIEQIRAKQMGDHLIGLGLPADHVTVTWTAEPSAPDGVNDAARRRVTITLVP